MYKKSKESETVTEGIFREFYGLGTFIEKSAISPVYGFQSKKQTAHGGYPDFFRDNSDEDFAIVVEAKANDFSAACTEVKFYATHNKVNKDIIAIAIAGQSKTSYKSALFLFLKGCECMEIKTDGKLLPYGDLVKLYRKEKYGESISTDALRATITQLNKEFQKNNIKDTERSLFFAGLMIALKDTTFINTYRNIQVPTKEERANAKYKLLDAHNLNVSILDAIVRQITNKINNLSKEYNWKDRFSFIKNIDFPLKEYKNLISRIEISIFRPFRMDEKQDILGRAYKIFLSKAGKIDNKNIILTPDHIKTLMVDLARLTIDDVVLDTCTGSGGFLMEAMEQLIALARNNSENVAKIKEKQLIGFEIDPTLFALACSNMFLHGDGRTNLIYGDSIVDSEGDMFENIRALKPTKCIINPPYENKKPIVFTKSALEFLEPLGKLIVIMPTPTLNRHIGGITDEILKIAKLDFVIKMPNNLFSEQGRAVNTSIFGFTKTPHEASDKVLFYNMEDDGLISVQHKGRVDKNNRWAKIRENVLQCVKYNQDLRGVDCQKRVISIGKIINCYGIKESNVGKSNLVKLGDLFTAKKGTLQSENNVEGKFAFITASETWKTHCAFEEDCEAIVYATQAAGSLGRAHYVKGKFIASNLCLVLKPKRDNSQYPINVQFYSMYLNALRKQIVNELADGTSKLTISTTELMNYYVEYFGIDEQNQLVADYNKKIKPAEIKLNKLKEKFNTKLQSFL